MYIKLFASILDSTLWYLPDTTRIVWITLMAMADREGYVFASPFNVSVRANVSLEATKVALATLSAPDPESRSKDFEGRRIEAHEDGWVLLNYRKYREIKSTDDRRERQARYLREKRANAKETRVDSLPCLHKEKEREKQRENEEKEPTRASAPAAPPRGARFVKPTEEEVAAYFKEGSYLGDPQVFCDFYESKGWVVGKAPMKDWKAAVRNWSKGQKERLAPKQRSLLAPPSQEDREWKAKRTAEMLAMGSK